MPCIAIWSFFLPPHNGVKRRHTISRTVRLFVNKVSLVRSHWARLRSRRECSTEPDLQMSVDGWRHILPPNNQTPPLCLWRRSYIRGAHQRLLIISSFFKKSAVVVLGVNFPAQTWT